MILDDGVATLFKKEDVSAPGEKPRYLYLPICKSFYKRLAFATSPARPTPGREERRIDLKIRITGQNGAAEGDRVLLLDVQRMEDAPEAIRYKITRAYHGTDEENGQPITDLELEAVKD